MWKIFFLLDYFWGEIEHGWLGFKLTRRRLYRLYYRKDKYQWRGPPLRTLLKLLCPLQRLQMDANDLYWMKKSELVFRLKYFFDFFRFSYFFRWSLSIDMCSFFQLKMDQPVNFHEVQSLGRSDLFYLALSDSACRFKSLYEERHANRLIWDNWAVLESNIFLFDVLNFWESLYLRLYVTKSWFFYFVYIVFVLYLSLRTWARTPTPVWRGDVAVL